MPMDIGIGALKKKGEKEKDNPYTFKKATEAIVIGLNVSIQRKSPNSRFFSFQDHLFIIGGGYSRLTYYFIWSTFQSWRN